LVMTYNRICGLFKIASPKKYLEPREVANRKAGA
jgi:hypothetical protein